MSIPNGPKGGVRRPWSRFVARGSLLLLGLGSTALFLAYEHMLPESSPYARGQRTVIDSGCQACHGAGRGPGASNPERGLVPSGPGLESRADFVPSLFTQNHSPAVLREWITNGIGGTQARSAAHRSERELDLLRMPAYGERLSSQQIDDLVVFLSIQATGLRPRAQMPEGERLARDHGCFDCHGALGQGGVQNPRSLKGTIPGFYGHDFATLTDGAKPEKVHEWIRDGAPRDFLDQTFLGLKLAQWFLRRQAISMPAFRDFLTTEQIEILVEYCLELHRLGPLGTEHLGMLRPSFADADPAEGPDAPVPVEVNFVQDIQPILEQRCLRCHGPEAQKSHYRLDTRDAALAGGTIARIQGRPAAIPGNADDSILIEFIETELEDEEREVYPMPPREEGRLTRRQIELLRTWVQSGMLWPPGTRLHKPRVEAPRD